PAPASGNAARRSAISWPPRGTVAGRGETRRSSSRVGPTQGILRLMTAHRGDNVPTPENSIIPEPPWQPEVLTNHEPLRFTRDSPTQTGYHPMMPPRIILSTLLAGLLLATAGGQLQAAKVYKYVNPQGAVTYSDTPP